ncbi:MAG: twin-arginine translocase subunit TatC [Thermoplasmata archaeon]
MASPRMTFFEHLEELRGRLIWMFAVFLAFFAIFVTLSLRFVTVGGLVLPYLWPDFFDSVSVQLVRFSLDYYLPSFVEPIQITPAEAIVVQFKVAMFLAILASMPMIVYQLAKFVAPGLYARERKVIARITIPATLLFLAGVLVAHFLLLPFVFDFLYRVGLNIGFETFARADPVFDIVLLFFLGMGLAFQTPVVMWGLTALGVLEPGVWKKYWRVAIVAFFFFGAVITPDGSGLTMMLVAAPMTVLYGVGYLLALHAWRARQGPKEKERGRSSPAVWSAVILLVGALVSGFVFLGTPLLAPPSDVATPVASGVINVTLPAFVLYSPQPLSPDMETGASFTADAETAITYIWSGTSSDGAEVAVTLNVTPESPLDATSDGPNMEVIPLLWTSSDLTSLRLATSQGSAGVYVLNLSVTYTVFEVGNRLVFAYEPTPISAAFVGLAEAGVTPPSPTERTLLERGRLASLGPAWELTTTVEEVRASNATFAHTQTVTQIPLVGRDLTLSLTRSFAWSPHESLDVWVRGSTSADFVYVWYLDDRFGSLYPVLLEA